MRPSTRIIAQFTRAALAASLLLVLAAGAGSALAHEGHSHDAPAAAATVQLASPRVVAISDAYQLVGIVEGEVLIIYLDAATDNRPITAATIEVTLNGEAFKAEPLRNGTYEVTAPLLRQPGQIAVIATVTDGTDTDLLVGVLSIGSAASGDRPAATAWWSRLLAAVSGHSGEPASGGGSRWLLLAALGIAVLAIAGIAGLRSWGRRALALAVLGTLLALFLAAPAFAHEGHDHGTDIKAAAGNSPQRRPDGSIFLPKPTQRLLEVRTAVIGRTSADRTVRLTGRIAANPNFSGVVQSTVGGRYEAAEGGVPPLGARIKKGDLLGRISPAFASIDSSDMAQTLGDIEQRLSIARAKLARQEQLLRTNVVAPALVDETRLEVEGLVKRRTDLLAARVRPEELRAPVDGLIAVSRVVSGQVVAQADRLFEIIDPARLLVEALIFDQTDPDAVTEAKAVVGADTAVKLRLLGRSRALQQQYTLMQFEIVDSTAPLNAGAPVTVVARIGAPVTGLFVPRAALAQAPNGQTVVFEHTEPEVFLPRAVRTEPFDSDTVLVTGGLEEGAKVVVRNAPLVNQVR